MKFFSKKSNFPSVAFLCFKQSFWFLHVWACAVLAVLALAPLVQGAPSDYVLLEAEGFAQPGGWVLDQQSMDQMGSAYLLAHGLGVPVADATTTTKFPHPGKYRLWVRTRDWVAPWKTAETHPDMRAEGTPGIFQVIVDGKTVPVTFGNEGVDWHWQDGGLVDVAGNTALVALHDLTGFAGRCDALLFSPEAAAAPPPNDAATLARLRSELLKLPAKATEMGEFDLVVVGGGAAGCCAAVSAARLGCKVAFIHDRPVLGGNNSSEVRVGLSGLISQKPYPRLGNLLEELGPTGYWNLQQAKKTPELPRSQQVIELFAQEPQRSIHNAGPESNYEDDRKLEVVRAEKNVTLFLSTRANGVEMDGQRIGAVMAQDIKTGKRMRFQSKLVADCTGDGVIGALAGADFAYGRESKEEHGEAFAPEKADELVMGTSVQWNSEETAEQSPFPACPWALKFDADHAINTKRGDWDWETGAMRNHVTEIEQIRDYGLRVVFGNWATLKNDPRFKDEFARQRLNWVAYIGGKRESRRILGDVVLRQQDIIEARPFPDASVTTTWTIDLHYPLKPMCACEAFKSEAKHLKFTPYPIPYRCLYSRNISNLMMAGRNISVTHVALGTVRVQRTTGMMGEVLGMASALCKKHATTPRGVYESYLAELKEMMQRGVGRLDLAAATGSYRTATPPSNPSKAKKAADIYLVCGQSNAWRLGHVAPAKEGESGASLYYFGMSCTSQPETARLQKIDRISPNTYGSGLASALKQASGRDVVLIQYAVCGSGLKNHSGWFPGEQPDKGKLNDAGIYGSFSRYMTDVRRQVEALGIEWKIAGVFWHQGESDVKTPPAEHELNLQHLFARFRQDFGNDLPIVAGEIREVDDDARTINRALAAADAADELLITVPAADISFDPPSKSSPDKPNVHFNTPGCHALGKRMATAMMSLSPVPPSWNEVRPVPMRGGLRAFWNVAGGDNATNEREAALHGFEMVDLLNTYSDYPGRQKENIRKTLDLNRNNPWRKPEFFERIIKRNIEQLGRAGAILVNDIEFSFEEDVEKAWADPVVRADSGVTTREQFEHAYFREWATWFTLPNQWAKERYPNTPIGLYGPQPFRRDFYGISGKSAQQIDGTHRSDAALWKHIDPSVDYYIASIYVFYDKPDSIYYMAANVEENLERTRRLGDKPLYAYLWLRYHNSNAKLVGQEVAPWLAESMAVLPYFCGARGIALWGSEPKRQGQYYHTLPVFMESLGRVSDLSEKIAAAKLMPDEPAHVLWKAKRPLIRRLRVSAEEWIVLTVNPWQAEDATSTLAVPLENSSISLEVRGRHTEIFHCTSGNVKRL